MSFHALKRLGQLPETWNRSVVFFANILSLFYGNEAEVDVLREEVGTLETYGSRLIPVINILFRKGPNTLILERAPNRSLLDYFTDVLNLSLPAIKVFSRKDYMSIGSHPHESDQSAQTLLAEIQKTEAQWIDGYVTESQLVRIAEITDKKTMSSLNGSYLGNNKLLLHRHFEKSGMPVFDTCIAEKQEDLNSCFNRIKRKGYRHAVVKASIGASGIGMVKVDLRHDQYDIPAYLFHEGSCLVQGWLDQSVEGIHYIGSPSVQMFIKEDRLTLHDITEQILSKDSVHEGNISPPTFMEYKAVKDELLSQAETAGTWLYRQGYRGTASADFHLVERKGEYEVRICEVNARVTGGTYPSMLAHHFLPGGVWLMRNILFSPPQTSARLLNIFKQHHLLFEPGAECGILPINLNPNEGGEIVKGQFLFLGRTHDDVFSTLEKIREDKGFKGVYDRD